MDECMFALLEDPEPQEILTPGVCVEVQYNTHTHLHTHTHTLILVYMYTCISLIKF